MNGVYAVVICFFIVGSLVGCGDGGNQVSTQDEMKAHVEKYGDTALAPAESSDPTPK